MTRNVGGRKDFKDNRGRLEPKAKKSEELAWCVGHKPVSDLIISKVDRIKTIYVIDSEKINRVAESGKCNFDRKKLEQVTKDQFLKLFDGIEVLNHQWTCARIQPSSGISLSQLISKSKKNGTGIIIGLDQIQDPANLGSIFRTAEALGADGIFYTKNGSASVSTSVRRVSVGATEFLPFAEVSNLATAIEQFKKEGYWIFGTSLSEGSLDIEETEILSPLVLLFGSEGEGLRQLTQKLCDRLVHIKQYGMVDSMNVACSVSALLFYVRSKLIKKNV